eukprot:1435789-Heterocapsa_arctica.AAC.1
MMPHNIRDPFGLWIKRKPIDIPWRKCPLETDSITCGCYIPAAYTVCPYCITPLVFTPAPASGAVRRMPVAAAAVARAVP